MSFCDGFSSIFECRRSRSRLNATVESSVLRAWVGRVNRTLLALPFGRNLGFEIHCIVSEATNLHDLVPDAVKKKVGRSLSGPADMHDPCIAVNMGTQRSYKRILGEIVQRSAYQLR